MASFKPAQAQADDDNLAKFIFGAVVLGLAAQAHKNNQNNQSQQQRQAPPRSTAVNLSQGDEIDIVVENIAIDGECPGYEQCYRMFVYTGEQLLATWRTSPGRPHRDGGT